MLAQTLRCLPNRGAHHRVSVSSIAVACMHSILQTVVSALVHACKLCTSTSEKRCRNSVRCSIALCNDSVKNELYCTVLHAIANTNSC